MKSHDKVLITGGAGLVGQNLIPQLKEAGFSNIVVLDKHAANLNILRSLHPDVRALHVDLTVVGEWTEEFSECGAVVQLHAQIGGLFEEEFVKNNVVATQNVLTAMETHGVNRLVHVSSSVVQSIADDWYTNTKKSQEQLVLGLEYSTVVLRPTLMFGWFDRKHLGWLSRFMKKSPIFPVPGNGRVTRQPLYAGDFSNIIVKCLMDRSITGVFNISGREKIDYIDIIKKIRRVTGARCLVMRIHPSIFRSLLKIWSRFDKNPPFTVQQLDALLANEEFEMFDWPAKFGITPTSFESAIEKTFCDPTYGSVVLEF